MSDETDIQVMVKYAHACLDPRHVQECNFDSLPFHILLAGELELIGRRDTSDKERRNKITIAKTLCYHKAYLKDGELRDGSDQMLKRIEAGTQDLDKTLGEHLQEHLHYQTGMIIRNKVQGENEHIIYCQDYNNGICSFEDHHDCHVRGKRSQNSTYARNAMHLGCEMSKEGSMTRH